MTIPPHELLPSPKLKPWHLDRAAVVYVRQSTPQQVTDHRESTARQYALAERAILLGWPRCQVQVIDEDLGKSGQSIEGRPGFQRLLAEVALDRVGLILGLEMSRLARSCKDGHQLLELCARFRVLLADADGVYDPTEYADRLLLGLTGMMSEAELHVLKSRMHQGKLNKARRGELVVAVPVGYGQRPTDPRRQRAGHPKSGRGSGLAIEDCEVFLKDRFPASISWERFEANQQRLAANRSRAEAAGAVRDGAALLAGLVWCGRCGRRMHARYGRRGQRPSYGCSAQRADYGLPLCQSPAAASLET